MNARTATDTPFKLLSHYAMRSRACALSASDVAPILQTWTGIGFSLGTSVFLVSMEDISEIINLPLCTKIPRTKSFVRGAANFRGSIIPVIDLMSFFNKSSSRIARLRRLLVVEYGESYTGLVVDDVLGMQHFPMDNFEASIDSGVESVFHPFLAGTYFDPVTKSYEIDRWPVFDLSRLLADERLENLSI